MYEQDHTVYHGGGGKGRQMLFACRGLLGPGFGMGYGVIDTPHTMKNKPSFLDYEHIMCFLSTNLYNLEDFDAEIEFTIGGEKHVFSEPTLVRIPAFTEDGPLVIKRIGKPFCFIHIFFTAHFHAPGMQEHPPTHIDPRFENM
jgi:hypothetical protein